MYLIIKIAIAILNAIYCLFKLLPVKNKITYISRQMNTIPLDFLMIEKNIEKKDATYEHVILAKMIPSGIVGKIGYCFHMLKQMYHIATSKAVLLDTYCIPISILKQRDSLIVIQIWHALGAFKKFGYSILDQEEGSSSKMAHLMKMHRNYTYVLASSDYTKTYFAQAFNVREEQMLVYPLPKTDLLINKKLKEITIGKILNSYPKLKKSKKKIIVYAPTFRKQNDDKLLQATNELINTIDFTKYELILKLHPLTNIIIHDSRIIQDNKYTSLEFFHLADYIITDYSAVIFEASLLDTPLYFYAFDLDEYLDKRSLYIDYNEMPGPISKNPKEIMTFINNNIVNHKKIEDFRLKMISPCHNTYTDDFVDFLLTKINKTDY